MKASGAKSCSRKGLIAMDGSGFERQGCTLDGKPFRHGAELCSIDFCVSCNDGKLKIPSELSRDEEDLLVDPGESYFVPV